MNIHEQFHGKVWMAVAISNPHIFERNKFQHEWLLQDHYRAETTNQQKHGKLQLTRHYHSDLDTKI
jgi:hypothetical protein